jgi:hypothetical protein
VDQDSALITDGDMLHDEGGDVQAVCMAVKRSILVTDVCGGLTKINGGGEVVVPSEAQGKSPLHVGCVKKKASVENPRQGNSGARALKVPSNLLLIVVHGCANIAPGSSVSTKNTGLRSSSGYEHLQFS